MPYRLSRTGKSVLIQRGGRWVTLKRHTSKEAAQKHLAALQTNVSGKHK